MTPREKAQKILDDMPEWQREYAEYFIKTRTFPGEINPGEQPEKHHPSEPNNP